MRKSQPAQAEHPERHRNNNPMADFTHVQDWIFDLDNTLYPAHCNLFAQIDSRMCQFIQTRLDLPQEKARWLQKHYYAVYGTTLHGLMKEHGIRPEDFLDYVHDIDVSVLPENPGLQEAIRALPGRRFIFTNGSQGHAENVAGHLGILDLFDGIFDIAASEFEPKPQMPAYDRFIRHFDIAPAKAAMFEDIPRNLEAPHGLGLTTVLVQSQADWIEDEPCHSRPARPGENFDHVHHVTECLTSFLGTLRTENTPKGDFGE